MTGVYSSHMAQLWYNWHLTSCGMTCFYGKAVMWHSRNITLCVTWDDWCIRQAWCIRHTSHLPHQSYHLLTPCLISYLPLISYSHVWSAINTLSYQLFTRLISYLHVWSAINTLSYQLFTRCGAQGCGIRLPSHSYTWSFALIQMISTFDLSTWLGFKTP